MLTEIPIERFYEPLQLAQIKAKLKIHLKLHQVMMVLLEQFFFAWGLKHLNKQMTF